MSCDELVTDVGELMAGFEQGLYTWLEVVSKTSELLEQHPHPDKVWPALPDLVRADLQKDLSTVDPATCLILGRPDEARARADLRRLIDRLRRAGLLA